MKLFYMIAISICLFLLFFAGCVVQIVNVSPSTTAVDPSVLKLGAGALLAIYEVLVRVIPSIGNYSIIHWLITALKFTSDHLNNSR